jgi:hypothetical protein
MSKDQWAWLEGELSKSRQYSIVILVSSKPWIGAVCLIHNAMTFLVLKTMPWHYDLSSP